MNFNVETATKQEVAYMYSNSQQISLQTGLIGHLRADFDGGNAFYTTWEDYNQGLKSQEFVKEFDEAINSLRFSGMLKSLVDMSRYCHEHSDAGFDGNYTIEYGFKVKTDKHILLLRCNPTKGDYNLYCYCYNRKRFEQTTIISTNKEDPVESKPVGRIDYLAFNGKVRESIEYTSEYKFVKDIKEENYYGVPMSIYVYADKDGKAIGRSFVSSLDPPPFGFKVIPSPYLQVDERSDVDDSFDDINPAVIRENLAERGIVNGEVVDEEALNNSPFIQQVMSDVEKIEDEDYSQYIGRELTIDGSKFRIEKYYPFAKEFSMLDLSSVYPLSRVEKVDFVLQLLKEQEKGYETEVVDVLPAVENGLKASFLKLTELQMLMIPVILQRKYLAE